MTSSASNIIKGPFQLYKDGLLFALTDDSTKGQILRGLEGETPEGYSTEIVWFTGKQGVVIEGNFLEYTLDVLEVSVPEITREGDILYFGEAIGQEIATLGEAVWRVHPVRDGTSKAHDWNLFRGLMVVDPLDIDMSSKGTRKIPFKLVALPDTTQDDGKRLMAIGDIDDTAAPARSTTSPVDTATDQAITVVPHIIFDKSLSRDSIRDRVSNERSVLLIDLTNKALVAAVPSFATSVLADDEVILTPAASLSNSTLYGFAATDAVYSIGGGQHAGSLTTFTTIAE